MMYWRITPFWAIVAIMAFLTLGWMAGRRTVSDAPVSMSVTVNKPEQVAPVIKTLSSALPELKSAK